MTLTLISTGLHGFAAVVWTVAAYRSWRCSPGARARADRRARIAARARAAKAGVA
ncbi:hypothetical protein [Streptomyces luteogriseus]|uniref:hypothetical protein n=1 Tax=Streptomyces luteogriseus TaxID=68233 RepID=UPI0037927CAC